VPNFPPDSKHPKASSVDYWGSLGYTGTEFTSVICKRSITGVRSRSPLIVNC
jgi:hypothetical protein